MGADGIKISLEGIIKYVVHGLCVHIPCDFGHNTFNRHVSTSCNGSI